MRKVLKIILSSLLAGACGVSAAAQEEPDTRNEFWPEVQLFVRLNPKTRLFFLANVSRARETRSNLEGLLGAHADYAMNKYLSFRGGYRCTYSLVEDDPFRDHRIIIEQTVCVALPARILMSYRNRQDLRFINGDFSARFRGRLMPERDLSFRRYKFTPYASGELFYDTRYDAWNRNRYASGAVWPLTEHVSFDTYDSRQNDSRSRPCHVNAMGLAVILSY